MFLLIVQYFLFLSKGLDLVLDFSPLLTLAMDAGHPFLFPSSSSTSPLLPPPPHHYHHLLSGLIRNLLLLSPLFPFLWIYFHNISFTVAVLDCRERIKVFICHVYLDKYSAVFSWFKYVDFIIIIIQIYTMFF